MNIWPFLGMGGPLHGAYGSFYKRFGVGRFRADPDKNYMAVPVN